VDTHHWRRRWIHHAAVTEVRLVDQGSSVKGKGVELLLHAGGCVLETARVRALHQQQPYAKLV